MTINLAQSILGLEEGITVIVITGGPCSGKTTGLSYLKQKLTDRGYKVLVVPETATKLISGGMTPGELSWPEFQEHILLDTMDQEARFFQIASSYLRQGKKVVVLCDRGMMDGEAYVGEKTFGQMLERFSLDRLAVRDGRYHAVMHLQTAAIGAEQFYTLENNAARIETPAQARKLDAKTLQAWQGHAHPRVIDNSTDFEGKMKRLLAEVCGVLGDPVPIEKEDKFLIKPVDLKKFKVSWTESQIVQDYLVSPAEGEERRVRARGDGKNFSYYYTVKRELRPGERVEQEKMITEREYQSLLTLKDPKMQTIRKRRICFFWKNQFFEVDIFEGSARGLYLMEAERTDRAPELKLPPFIKVVKNVTGDKRYSNKRIAAGSVN
ncbi:MAG: AAA family ATPase [Candidatus Paceibacterota bacterium]|jgi:CYTH domain-containing protein/thymidylate kinase